MSPASAVTVVVPTLGRSPLLADLLTELGSDPELDCVVVDGSGSAVEVPAGVRTVRTPNNVGFAQACNLGAGTSGREFILFCNDDVRTDAAVVTQLSGVAESDPAAAVWQPVVLSEDGSVESTGTAFTWSGFLRQLTQVPPDGAVFSAVGAFMLVRRSVFAEVGGFRSTYFAYFEDADLCWRLRLAGWEVRTVPHLAVTHALGTTTRSQMTPSLAYHLGYRNRLRSILSNASAPTLFRILPLHLAGCMLASLGFLTSGRPGPALAVLRALAWPIANLGHVRVERRGSRHARRVPDRDVLRPSIVRPIDAASALRALRANLRRW